MARLIERVLERAGLAEEELSSCGSVNLPEGVQEFLDLTPAQVVGALRADELDKLAESKTVWLSGWEPSETLRRLLEAVRGVLNERPAPPRGGRFYRRAGEQLKAEGRISHGRLLAESNPDDDEPPTSIEQRVALRLRGKLKGHVASAEDLDDVRGKLSGATDESS